MTRRRGGSEYQSLRTESLQAQHAQQTILQFGITGVAVLVGLSLQLKNQVLAILLLLYMVPLVSIFIVSVWFTEIFRSLRAGDFLAYREKRINEEIGSEVPALEWETWLRQPEPERRMFNRTRMSFGVLCTLNVAGFVLAGYVAGTAEFHISPATVIILGVASLTLLAVSIVVYRRYERRFYKQPSRRKAAAQTPSSTAEEIADDRM
jgi:positive regulator of sigma E activity